MSRYLIITGGSRGIGEQTINCFQSDGWEVINLSRTPCRLPNVKQVKVDLADCASIYACRDDLLSFLTAPSQICLVHNAAFYQPDSLDSLSMAVLSKTLQINVLAAVALNQLLIPLMPAKSSIIYIGSTLAVKAVPGSASYVISKHALIGLMKATCQDLKDKSIHTCCVCPGLVETKLLRDTIPETAINFLLDNVIIGKRLIQPDEIAKFIHFCSTTDIINGAVLQANLGEVAS